MSKTNGRLIDRIIAKSSLERRVITVPEWEVDLYFRPLTRAEMEAAMPTDDVERPSTTQGLFLLVHMAEDADGKKVFKPTDIEALRTKADLAVLTRVESFMWGTMIPSVREARKEIEADPLSAPA